MPDGWSTWEGRFGSPEVRMVVSARAEAGIPREVRGQLHDKVGGPLGLTVEVVVRAISIGLANGVPLGAMVHGLTNQAFAPSGVVLGDPHVQRCTSCIDYLVRSLAARFPEAAAQVSQVTA